MGCKGSKLDDVATGNTVRNRLLRRKQEAGKSSNRNIATAESKSQEKSDAEEEKGVSDEQCKVNGASLKAGEEGKGVEEEEPDSPDEYFSPRKGDQESVGDPLDYQSPRSEADGGGKREEGPSNAVQSKEEAERGTKGAEEKPSVDDKAAATVVEAKLGQNDVSNKESAKLKEILNVVEAANKESSVEKRANHVGEMTEEKESVDSSADDQNISKQLTKDGD